MIAGILALYAKAKAWVYGIGAVLLIIAGAWVVGRRQGTTTTAAKDHDAAVAHDADQKAATAQATAQRIQTKEQTNASVQSLPTPASDPAPVATAPAGTAAGKLRESWLRQEN